jgi:hypothetical protein
MFRKRILIVPVKHAQHTSQPARRLAGVATLGAWITGWFGLILPVALPQETAQPGHLKQEATYADRDTSLDEETTGQDVDLLLPDMRTLPPFDLRIVPLADGRRELRLSNTIWNSGQGPLELNGEFNAATSQIRVYQHVITSNGSPIELLVGEFIWHPTHDHWHFEDFTLYELRSLQPDGELDSVATSSDKLSYCLLDTDPVEHANPAFSPYRNYFDCGQSLQGLSAGWGDTYKSHLDGQALDITALPDGYYALVSTVNPGVIVMEANYKNNSALVYLEIRGSKLEVITLDKIRRGNCLEQCGS